MIAFLKKKKQEATPVLMAMIANGYFNFSVKYYKHID